ncbi:hypothetical protein AB0H12_27245 [Actinosynnema sp. NPDC023794]
MTEPVVRWTSGPDRLADVLVREMSAVDGGDPTAELLRDNPFAALAVAASADRLVVRTEFGQVVELTPAATAARCLDVQAVVASAVQSLYAWHVARLDLSALRPRGLPVWCAEHRARRSAVACGWLRVVVLDVQSSSDAGGL